MSIHQWAPRVAVVPEGGAALSFLLDTGSGLTIRSQTASTGVKPLSFASLGLQVTGFPVAMLDLFRGKSPCQVGPPGGILGGDFLRWFRLRLDYPSSLATLFPADSAPPAANGLLASLPLSLVGGGEVSLPGGGGSAMLPDAWPVVRGVEVEGLAMEALLDTGASFCLVSPGLLKELGGSGRPGACCQTLVMAGGQERARFTRLRKVRLGKQSVESLPVLVLDRQGFWDDLALAAGRKIKMVLGGSLLRRFRVDIDYGRRSLYLAHSTKAFAADGDEFNFPGFSFCRAAGQNAMVVLDVYKGSAAAKLGIKGGELITRVEGVAVDKRTAAEVLAQLRKLSLGSEVSLTIEAKGERKVKMELLLPEYK